MYHSISKTFKQTVFNSIKRNIKLTFTELKDVVHNVKSLRILNEQEISNNLLAMIIQGEIVKNENYYQLLLLELHLVTLNEMSSKLELYKNELVTLTYNENVEITKKVKLYSKDNLGYLTIREFNDNNLFKVDIRTIKQLTYKHITIKLK